MPTLEVVEPKVKTSKKQSSTARTLLTKKARPFQMMCKTVRGKTITIDDMKATSLVSELLDGIEAKDGIPPDAHYLIYGGKVLETTKELAFYGIGRDSTVHSLMRLRGGYGEREAIEHVVSLNMNRGNVGPEVLDTEGRSYALKAFGRDLKDDNAFKLKIKAKVNLGGGFDAWWNANKLHIKALIQETTHSGNCGDFAQIVASNLVQETDSQYVYQVVMHGKCTGPLTNPDCTFKAPHSFDHQLCVTYPTNDGTTDRDDPTMLGLKLSGMKADIANVADGWHNHRIITLKEFMKQGGNCYHKLADFTNLKILPGTADKCGRSKLTKKQRTDISALIDVAMDEHKTKPEFTFNRFASLWNATKKVKPGPSYAEQAEAAATKAKLIGGTTGKDWSDLVATINLTFKNVVDRYSPGFKPHYEGYTASLTKPQYLVDLAKKLGQWGWKDPEAANFLGAVKAQSGLETAIHALLGAATGISYFDKKSGSLPTFNMAAMGPMLDERSTSDINKQIATIDVSNWTLFKKEAAALSNKQLLGYFMESRVNRNRVLHTKKIRDKVFDYIEILTGNPLVQALTHLEVSIVDYALHSDAAEAMCFRPGVMPRLYATLNLHPNNTSVRLCAEKMTTQQFTNWVESSPAATKKVASIGTLSDKYANLLDVMDDGNCENALTRLANAGRLAAILGSAKLRTKMFNSDALRQKIFDWNLHHDRSLVNLTLMKFTAKLTRDQILDIYDQFPAKVMGDKGATDILFNLMDGSQNERRAIYPRLHAQTPAFCVVYKLTPNRAAFIDNDNQLDNNAYPL